MINVTSILQAVKQVSTWGGWNSIEHVLAVAGIGGIVLAVVRFFHNSALKTWKSNVTITDYPFNYDAENNEVNAIYVPLGYERAEPYMSTIVLKAVDCIIPKLSVYTLSPEFKPKKTRIAVYRNLTPEDALCFCLERAEIFPLVRIRWYTDYGEYYDYDFTDNLRNGLNDVEGVQYKSSFFSAVRKMLGLR